MPGTAAESMSRGIQATWGALAIVGQSLQSFQEYPPSQVSVSNSVTRFLEAIQNRFAGGGK
jgi:hypothetical protein